MSFLSLSTFSSWVMTCVSLPMMTSRSTSVQSYRRPSRSNCPMGSVEGSVLGERSYTLRISMLSLSSKISTGSMASGSVTSKLTALAGSVSMVKSRSDAVRDKILFFTDISSSGLILLFLESGSSRRRVLSALNQRLQVGDHKAQGIEHDPGHDDSLQPTGRLCDGPLIAGDHPHQQRHRSRSHCHDGRDAHQLAIDICDNRAEPCPHGVRSSRRLGEQHHHVTGYRRHLESVAQPLGRLHPAIPPALVLCHLLPSFSSYLQQRAASKRLFSITSRRLPAVRSSFGR